MKKFPLSLPKLCTVAAAVFITACQSPSRPQNSTDSSGHDENEYPQEMARVVAAFQAIRSDSAFLRQFGPAKENQFKLLSREFPLVMGDFDADGDPDAIASFSVLGPEDERIYYAVFLRDKDSLRLAQVLPRGGNDARPFLTLSGLDGKGMVRGEDTADSLAWTVIYKWEGNGLHEVSRAPKPDVPK
ncbi:hypothetical protein ACQKLP_10590 [Chitinophaga sp. NPDC101104]|uniref:hypothetical protein n=1 Tax=Chitinophaga sp. NPDC101104 TaxID=3390561 RepID=UPI003CFF19E4